MPSSKSINKATRLPAGKQLRNRSVRRSVKTYIAKAESSAKAKEELTDQKTVMAVSTVKKIIDPSFIFTITTPLPVLLKFHPFPPPLLSGRERGRCN